MKVINNIAYQKLTLLLVFFSLLNMPIFTYAQKALKDTTVKDSTIKHNPKIAVICSAVVPGLGQVYNKKIWKVPIIYVGLGTLLYYWDHNNKQYQFYKESYIKKDTLIFGGTLVYGSNLIFWRDKFRRYRDLNMIGAVLLYILNVVDASVDANLFDFDVSDDLSMKIEPEIKSILLQKNSSIGITCRINF